MARIHKLGEQSRSNLSASLSIGTFISGVRELLRNSIDAGATRIDLRLDFGSLSVLCADNGNGIAPHDMNRLGERDTSSKSFRDAHTFGCRGAALHSLQSISKLTVVSKVCTFDETFRFQNGTVEHFDPLDLSVNPVGAFQMPTKVSSGTVVVVSQLFWNIPVRHAQMLMITEQKHYEELKLVLLEILMMKHDISLTVSEVDHQLHSLVEMLSVGMQVFASNQTNGADDLSIFAEILQSLYGSAILPHFESLSATFKDFKLSGVVGTSPINSKRHQYIFCNRRRKVLSKEDTAYFNSIFEDCDFGSKMASIIGRPFHRFPVFLLNVDFPSDQEDIQKSWFTIRNLAGQVMLSFLKSQGYEVFDAPVVPTASKRRKLESTPSRSSSKTEVETPASPSKRSGSVPDHGCTHINHIYENSTDSLIHIQKKDLENYSIVGQVQNKFVLARVLASQIPTLIVLDQHACDERIRVESIFQEFVTNLLDPDVNLSLRLQHEIVFGVSQSEKSLFQQYAYNFELFGICYTIEDFDVRITHLPMILCERVNIDSEFLKACFVQHIYDMDRHLKLSRLESISMENWFKVVAHLPRVISDLINSKACRSAIMFGDNLNKSQMNNLVTGLSKCNLPFQCAHGRPTLVPLSSLTNDVGTTSEVMLS